MISGVLVWLLRYGSGCRLVRCGKLKIGRCQMSINETDLRDPALWAGGVYII